MKVLITGGSRGIGLETARLFVEQGAEVWIFGRDQKKIAAAQKELNAKATVGDVGQAGDVARLFNEITGTWKSLDLLVNNAADIFVTLIEKMALERVKHLLDVNVVGVIACCQKAIPLLRKGDFPSIVNVASIAGIWGRSKFPGFGAYNASKAAVLGLTEVLALELAKDQIRVNAVSPGSVDTEMFHQNVPKGYQPAMTPREVAKAIHFLSTTSSRPMNGRNIELF